VATARNEIEQSASRRAQIEEIIRTLGADRDRLRNEVQEAEQGQREVRAQLAKLTEDLASRTRELAAVEGQVETARRELADTQAKLAEARQQLSTPASAPPQAPARQ
jgi:chromosome segregation ATPase